MAVVMMTRCWCCCRRYLTAARASQGMDMAKMMEQIKAMQGRAGAGGAEDGLPGEEDGGGDSDDDDGRFATLKRLRCFQILGVAF
jgi:hypothetical protein